MRTLMLIALAALTMIAPAYAQGTVLTGEVTYRERIALPVPAELVVSLVELSSGTSIASATASIPERGHVPLAYSLNLRQLPPEDKEYGLVAQILRGGKPMFQNFDPVPVDPAAPLPTIIFVHHVAEVQPVIDQPQVIIMDPTASAPSSLLGSGWTVLKIHNEMIEAPRKPSIGFDTDGRVYGTGGCNRYFTTATISEPAISFGVGGATNMACDTKTMRLETEFFAALAEVVRFKLEGDVLQLLGTSGNILLELTRS